MGEQTMNIKDWNSSEVTPPDKRVQVVDEQGKILFAHPCFYSFNIVMGKVIPRERYWGGWIIEVGFEFLKFGKIIGWRNVPDATID